MIYSTISTIARLSVVLPQSVWLDRRHTVVMWRRIEPHQSGRDLIQRAVRSYCSCGMAALTIVPAGFLTKLCAGDRWCYGQLNAVPDWTVWTRRGQIVSWAPNTDAYVCYLTVHDSCLEVVSCALY